MHHNFDDSDSGYDMDTDHGGKPKGFSIGGSGGYRGRIIFLGDGTEVLTDTDDTTMFDDAEEEDRDLDQQVGKSASSGASESSKEDDAEASTSASAPEKKDEESKPAVPAAAAAATASASKSVDEGTAKAKKADE